MSTVDSEIGVGAPKSKVSQEINVGNDRQGYVDPKDMDLPTLFDRFERDMIWDAHSFGMRYSRSEARREIQRRSTDPANPNADHKMIYDIVEFLRSGKSSEETVCRDHVDGGWARLVGAIARRERLR